MGSIAISKPIFTFRLLKQEVQLRLVGQEVLSDQHSYFPNNQLIKVAFRA